MLTLLIVVIYLFVSGRTEFQTTQQNRARRTVQFERRPSQRFARRQSTMTKTHPQLSPPVVSQVAPEERQAVTQEVLGESLPE